PRSVLPPPCRQQPPPPFPYTTLFRSPPALLALPLGPSNALSLGPGFVGPEYGFAASAEAGIADESPDHGSLLAPPLRLPPSSDIDRKSTRLNSSHVKSSYAVFCLKKK